jgi:hypothetical protein
MNNYYNTIGLEGVALSNAINKAKTQQDRILFIFNMQRVSMTPDEVHNLYRQYFYEVPLTSIRRGITNLTNDGELIKTDRKVIGRYGSPNYKWSLNKK